MLSSLGWLRAGALCGCPAGGQSTDPGPPLCGCAANNPSESIIAKRRGYGTIVSHNVPPYGRAGLYKQLAELQSMVTEFREDPDGNQVLRRPILAALQSAGEPAMRLGTGQ